MKTIELREQVGGCVGDRSHRILGMRSFPRGERLVSAVEVEVVHLAVAGLQVRRRNAVGCLELQRTRKKEASSDAGWQCRADSNLKEETSHRNPCWQSVRK